MLKTSDIMPEPAAEPAVEPTAAELSPAQLDEVSGGLISFDGVAGESSQKDHKGADPRR